MSNLQHFVLIPPLIWSFVGLFFIIWYLYMSQRTTKATKWHVCPAKTKISLGIRPVWSESLLSPRRKHGSLATHWVHSEDWSDWADAQADLSLHWVHMLFCWFYEVAHMSSVTWTWKLGWPALVSIWQWVMVIKWCPNVWVLVREEVYTN